MYEATVSANYPDDELSRLFHWLVRSGGLLETHDHGGVHATTSEVFALGELADGGVRNQRELAERLGLEKSTVSRLAAAMEQKGWLVRERDPVNRRFYCLALTNAGHHASQRIGEHLKAHHHEILARLTAEERAGLAIGLAGLARALHHPGHH